jgi:hypothetical protein
VDVERGQERTAGTAGVVERDAADAVASAPDIEGPVDVARLDRVTGTSREHERVMHAADARVWPVATITRGLSEEEGGYHWSGELRLWDNEILMGWCASTEGSIRSKGTMYFVLHPHGLNMAGRWVGLGYDDRIMDGWASMGKTREQSEDTMVSLTFYTASRAHLRRAGPDGPGRKQRGRTRAVERD